jgi:hypothetical protein
MTPLILLTAYPIIGIPLVLVCIAKDLLVKHEGFLAWHRNSVGLLLQRMVFTTLTFISFLTFSVCNSTLQTGPGMQHCIISSLIPLILSLTCILLKVSLAMPV